MMEQAWGGSLRASRRAWAVGVRWARVTSASLLLVGLALAGAAPARAQEAWPGASWTSATPASVGMDPAKTRDAIGYGASRGGSGILIRSGKRVGYWGSQTAKYGLKSSTKSVGSIILGLAIKDDLVGPDTKVQPILPELGVPPSSNNPTGWLPLITVRHLATHTAGFEKPGGFGALQFRPGTAWLYSDGATNWLADLLTVSYHKDLRQVLQTRVLNPMAIGYDQLLWRRNAYRPQKLREIERREFGSGISTSVDVMARLGLMLLRDGRWRTTQILPANYADVAGAHQQWLDGFDCRDPDRCPGATKHYGLLFWNNANGAMANVPKDAYWSHGLGNSFILVMPSLDVVVARAGPAWGSANQYQLLQPFFARVAQAVN